MMRMDETSYRLPYLLDLLDRNQLRQILVRFSEILPFPLVVINPEGKLVAASSTSTTGSLRFYVDRDHHVVTEVIDIPEYPPRKALSAPVYFQDEGIGYVVLCQGQALNDEDLYRSKAELVANVIGDKVYAEYELENLTEELVEKYNEITLIYEVSEALGAVFDPKTVCEIILKEVVGVVGVGKASIMLYDEQSNCLYIAASHGIDLTEDEIRQVRVVAGKGVSGQVFATGEHMIIENTENTAFPEISLLNRGYKTKSFLSVPMIFKPMNMEKKVMGVINMTDKKSSEVFTSGDLRLLTAIGSQAAMSLYNIRLIEELKDAERFKREMEIAKQIQTALLPGDPPEFTGLDLAGRCFPATQVGGDYYDFFPISENQLGLVIADVSGHDVGSAFIMATARSALRSEILARKSPAKILEDTNLVLYEDLTHAEKFITIFYAEYDTTTRILRYSNGGHNCPILLRDGTCTLLDTDGMVLGVLDFVAFEEKTLRLEQNDFLLFYTDGVVEAKNTRGEMLTLQRLCHILEIADRRCNACELLESIYEELEQYSNNTLRTDDLTIMVLKIR
jgi:sigma-B regulation protein RsbU (phosphoserine phosphatase)